MVALLTHAGTLRLLLLLSMAACRPSSIPSDPAPAPAIAPPAASARIQPMATPDAGPPVVVSFARLSTDAPWVSTIPRARRFRRLTLAGAGAVRLGWIRESEHLDEGAGAARATVRLVLERDGHTAVVDFGDLYGEMDPMGLAFCARAGYRGADGSRLEPPRIDGLVSTASVGSTSGDVEVLVILSGAVLHVLDRQTSDGTCESETRQGPMTVCRGEQYVRAAEIRLATPPATFEESVAVTTETDPGTLSTHPLDCAGPTMQLPLLPPT